MAGDGAVGRAVRPDLLVTFLDESGRRCLVLFRERTGALLGRGLFAHLGFHFLIYCLVYFLDKLGFKPFLLNALLPAWFAAPHRRSHHADS